MSEYHCMSKALCCGLGLKVKPARIQNSSSSSGRYEVTFQQKSGFEWIEWDHITRYRPSTKEYPWLQKISPYIVSVP